MSPKRSMYKYTNKSKIKNSLTHFKGLTMPFFPENEETPFCASFPASFTVEAAVSVPVFLCFFAALLFFFQVMKLQMQTQDALNYTGRVLSEYACLEADKASTAGRAVTTISAGTRLIGRLKERETVFSYIDGGAAGIRIWDAGEEGDYIKLHAAYRIKFPIGIFGKITLPVRQHVKVHKWTGQDIGGKKEEEVWVYVTENGRVYHRTRKCSYLDLTIRGVSMGEAARLRNKSGAKYKPCGRCMKSACAYVYITDYGDAYHGALDCSGLKRSIYKIKLSEAGGKKACAKCGGEK